jgi:hypothetical protein
MTKDPFREPWGTIRIVGVIALVAVFVLVVSIKYYSALSPAQKIFGVVQTSGPGSVGGIYGGTRDMALVRLVDGRVVPAYVNAGGPLPPGVGGTLSSGPLLAGDTVTLLMQPRVWGPPSYEIITKNNRDELRPQSDAPLQ